MAFEDVIAQRIDGACRAIESLRDQIAEISEIGSAVVRCLREGGTIYTCGNGGSAAEAMHLAEELIGRYRSNRRPLRAICLNADPTALTCIANDFEFAEVFARQVEALITQRDLLIAFSTSGKSANLVKAIEAARAKGAAAIGLLGRDGGACASLSTHKVVVGCNDSGHVQEAHQVLLHILCEAAEGLDA